MVDGNIHCVKFVDLFDRYHPDRFMAFELELYSSIQSEYEPVSSISAVWLSAMNSEIRTLPRDEWGKPIKASDKRVSNARS